MNLDNTPKENFKAQMRAMMQEMRDEMSAGMASGVSMTAAEQQFFNEINENVGLKEGALLPQETINSVFDAIANDFPFLNSLNVQNMGLSLKVITAETSGTAIWGEVFDSIKGQLDQKFGHVETMQNKLTAFIVVPKDLQDFGPDWIKRFVTQQLIQAMSVALEAGFISGDGSNQPIGLDRDLKSGEIVDGKTVYAKKAVSGVLDFTNPTAIIAAVASAAQELLITEDGKMVAVDNKIWIAVNPLQYEIIRGAFTVQNDAGIYVEQYPLGISVVPANGVVFNEALIYLPGRYDAAMGGGIKVTEYDQTLAMEDLNLDIAKAFAFGKARDNNVARRYVVKVPNGVEEYVAVTGVTPSQQTASMAPGATKQVSATVAPSTASNQAVTWATSDAEVATVTQGGLITAVADGTANVTVTTVDGDFVGTIAVTVTTPE